MRSLHSLLLMAALGACSNHALPADKAIESTFPKAPPVATQAREMRVVAFNVHMEPGDKIAKALADDEALRNADVIMLEEVHRREKGETTTCSGACVLGKKLGFYALYAAGHAARDGSDGIGLLSRSPIVSAEIIELPYFDTHFNSQRKVAIAAHITVDGKPVTVYTVHLDNRISIKERRRQMLPILEHAEKQTNPVIIAGDFNTSPFTWISHVIPVPIGTQDDRLEELVRAHGFATPSAGSGPTHQAIGMKLDAIYTRGFDTLSYSTADADNLSDHFAIWAQLRLKPS